jgi:glycosyltransferase involved in cell wall biosynthesis
MSTIFVQIASYKDPQLIPTIDDCIKNAKHPENLRFGIAWQHAPEENIDKYKNDSRFKIIDIPYQESKGACWARNKIQQEYGGEKYTLQLDSHHRFIKNWDAELIQMIKDLQSKGHKKPILTSYLPSYFPDKDPDGRIMEPWILNIERFLPEGAVFLRPSSMPDWQNQPGPFPSRFLSGHFIFTLGKFNKEVPYDPDFYFHGEETSLAVRAFTHGYDLFSPHKLIAWHEYSREGSARHWDDHSTWNDKDKKSYARFRALFDMGNSTEDITGFGFGKVRTLQDYENYSGLKFSTRQIHEETLREDKPPVKGDFIKGLKNKVKTCISIYKGSLLENDYNVFVVAMLDEQGKDLYRRDVEEEEIKRLLNEAPNDKFIHVWVDYEDNRLPHTSRFWPCSKSKGWCDRTEQVINYE